jgi:hypothetical protein
VLTVCGLTRSVGKEKGHHTYPNHGEVGIKIQVACEPKHRQKAKEKGKLASERFSKAERSRAEQSGAEQSRAEDRRREEKRREDAYAYPIVCCMLHETRVYILYIEFNFSQTAGQNRAEYRRAEQSRAEQSKAK